MDEDDEEYSEEAVKELDLAIVRAKAELDKAMSNYVVLRARRIGFDSAYLSGYVAYAEYISPQLIQEDATAGFPIVAEDQAGSTSRGLFEFGSDAFKRAQLGATLWKEE